MKRLLFILNFFAVSFSRADEWLQPGPHHVPQIVESIRDEVEGDPSKRLFVIAGLGNSGARYIYTRHNFGRIVLGRMRDLAAATPEQDQYWREYNQLANKSQVILPLDDRYDELFGKRFVEDTVITYDNGEKVTENIEFQSEPDSFRTSRGEVFVERVRNVIYLYVVPFHDINESGVYVASVMDVLNQNGQLVGPQELIIVLDEMDFPFGKTQLSAKSSKLHGASRSLLLHLPEELHKFLRLRMGIGRSSIGLSSAQHVLEPFSDDERKSLDALSAAGSGLIRSHCRDLLQQMEK